MPRATTRVRLLGAMFCMALLAAACGDDDSSSGYQILPPDAEVGGQDAAALLSEAGVAQFEVPAEQSSITDPNNCDQGMSTDDVYYAPTFGAPGEATASCTMKRGQVLFLNPVAAICIEEAGDTADTACLDAYWDLTSSSVTIDGTPVTGLDERLYDTGVDEVNLPEDNLLGVDPVTTKMIQRGQVVLVKDLPAGTHTVELAGNFADGEFAGRLILTLVVE